MPAISTAPEMLAIVAFLAYLLGGVPFGLVIARLFGLGDLRSIGSGNIGATNVLRTGNRLAAFLTLVLDAGKGGLAVLAARTFVGEDAAQVAGLAAFLGHLYPVWLRFRGGKGVATFLGTLLVLAFPVGAAACLVWLIVAVVMRYSSLSALVAAASAPIIATLIGHTQAALVIAAMAILIFWRHRSNIWRLWNGQEPRIKGKS